jgi:DNA polymerase-1
MKLRGAARVRKLLEEKKGDAFLSRDLATVKRDVPVDVSLENLAFQGPNREKLEQLFSELNFTQLLKTLQNQG